MTCGETYPNNPSKDMLHATFTKFMLHTIKTPSNFQNYCIHPKYYHKYVDTKIAGPYHGYLLLLKMKKSY